MRAFILEVEIHLLPSDVSFSELFSKLNRYRHPAGSRALRLRL